MANCRSCGEEIEWVKTAKGKNLPINKKSIWVDTPNGPIECYRTHFETCPNADEHRKPKTIPPQPLPTNQYKPPSPEDDLPF